ncbi:MAG: hypothetical protein ACREQF_10040, partial [Candidatus Binataceae bacterium]
MNGYHFGDEPEGEGLRQRVPDDDYLTVIWQPNDRMQKIGTREALSKEFDHIVIDVDAALEDTV